jgi:hypothetical protein
MTEQIKGRPARWLTTAEAAAPRRELEGADAAPFAERGPIWSPMPISHRRAVRSIHRALPDHQFLGEEETPGTLRGRLGAGMRQPGSRSARWHDELCSRRAVYCVSIGLMVEGELVVGVIFDPRQKNCSLPPLPERR